MHLRFQNQLSESGPKWTGQRVGSVREGTVLKLNGSKVNDSSKNSQSWIISLNLSLSFLETLQFNPSLCTMDRPFLVFRKVHFRRPSTLSLWDHPVWYICRVTWRSSFSRLEHSVESPKDPPLWSKTVHYRLDPSKRINHTLHERNQLIRNP